CSIVVLSLFTINTSAQSAAEKFTVEGIPVIMKSTVKDIINVSIYYRGGVANYKAEQAGLGNLALSAATECGTKKYTKDAFKDMADKYGIDINSNGTYDYGIISLNCITKYFNEGWDLLTEAVNNPVYEEKEFDLLKQKVISGIKSQESNPDSKINKMAVDYTFKGTVYETDPKGEVNTVTGMTAADAKSYYYNTLLDKSKMFIVVVGKISKQEITDKIKKAFSAIASKQYVSPSYKMPSLDSNSINIVSRKLATNYIMGVVNAPNFTSDDFVANRVAFATFSQNLFTEIRTKRNLSYAPYAYTVPQEMPYSIMYVSTTNPKASVEVMVNEIKRIKEKGFSQKEFNDTKNLFITSNYMKQESTNAMAASLGNAEVLGNWKMSEEFIGLVQKTTPEEMTNSFKTHIKGINWNYLGDEKAADEAKGAFQSSVN
ncbi:MAG: pitrilysin family protein, partial [Ginsengibacter sp.]